MWDDEYQIGAGEGENKKPFTPIGEFTSSRTHPTQDYGGEVEKNWLIRTRQGQILGPISRKKILEFFEKGHLGPDDEICSGSGYWFYVREQDLFEKYVIAAAEQSFNPISEAPPIFHVENEIELVALEEDSVAEDSFEEYTSTTIASRPKGPAEPPIIETIEPEGPPEKSEELPDIPKILPTRPKSAPLGNKRELRKVKKNPLPVIDDKKRLERMNTHFYLWLVVISLLGLIAYGLYLYDKVLNRRTFSVFIPPLQAQVIAPEATSLIKSPALTYQHRSLGNVRIRPSLLGNSISLPSESIQLLGKIECQLLDGPASYLSFLHLSQLENTQALWSDLKERCQLTGFEIGPSLDFFSLFIDYPLLEELPRTIQDRRELHALSENLRNAGHSKPLLLSLANLSTSLNYNNTGLMKRSLRELASYDSFTFLFDLPMKSRIDERFRLKILELLKRSHQRLRDPLIMEILLSQWIFFLNDSSLQDLRAQVVKDWSLNRMRRLSTQRHLGAEFIFFWFNQLSARTSTQEVFSLVRNALTAETISHLPVSQLWIFLDFFPPPGELREAVLKRLVDLGTISVSSEGAIKDLHGTYLLIYLAQRPEIKAVLAESRPFFGRAFFQMRHSFYRHLLTLDSGHEYARLQLFKLGDEAIP